VRGLLPWPTAYTIYKEKFLKILETEIIECHLNDHNPGDIIEVGKQGFTVATADKGLLVKHLHYESSKPMDAPQLCDRTQDRGRVTV